MNKTKKKIKKKIPALLPAIKNFALIIPEKGANLALSFYLKFSTKFWKRVDKELKKIPNQDTASESEKNKNIVLAVKKTVTDPKFKKAWKDTITKIMDILLLPLVIKLIILIEKQGFMVANAVAKVGRKIATQSTASVAEGAKSALAAVPGVGTVLGILTIFQALFDSMATLSIQSIRIMTGILGSVLSMSGALIKPLAKVGGIIKPLVDTIKGAKNKTASTLNKTSDEIATVGQRK